MHSLGFGGIRVPRVEVHEVEKQVMVPQIQEVVKEVPRYEIQTVEKIVEVPHIEYKEQIVEVPQIQTHEVVRHVPKIEVQEVVKEVKKIQVQTVERSVEIPQVEYRERIVEVPEVHIQEVVKHVPRVQVQEVVKEVKRTKIQTVETIVEVPQVQTVERFVEVPKIVEVPQMVPQVGGTTVMGGGVQQEAFLQHAMHAAGSAIGLGGSQVTEQQPVPSRMEAMPVTTYGAPGTATTVPGTTTNVSTGGYVVGAEARGITMNPYDRAMATTAMPSVQYSMAPQTVLVAEPVATRVEPAGMATTTYVQGGGVTMAPAPAGGVSSFSSMQATAPVTYGAPGTATTVSTGGYVVGGAGSASLFDQIDTNKDGVISREEFAQAVQQ